MARNISKWRLLRAKNNLTAGKKSNTAHVNGVSAEPLLRIDISSQVITPPEVANTGPGVNRGSGGGARGCGFEERVGVYARTEGGHFLYPFCPSACVRACLS